MKRKLLSIIVAFFATTALWAYDFKSGDLHYYTTTDSTAGVTYQKYSSSDNYSGLTSVIVPESVTYNGETYSVTSIGQSAFAGCSGLTSVTIPNSVTSIGRSAFAGCSGLTSVTIPNNVTYIAYKAFEDCSHLTSIVVESGNTAYDSRNNCNAIIETKTNTLIVGCPNTTIPDGVTSIGSSAFSGCSGLTSVTIPNSVTSIGGYAFYGCSGLTSITIPNSVTSIGNSAFLYCRGLTSVTIPNSVTSIGEWAFGYVANIVYSGKAEGAPWGAKSMNGYVDGYLVYSDATKTNLLACSSAAQGTITIPNSVTSIGIRAFEGCSGLTSVTIGNSVTSIGEYAFLYCRDLTSVTIPNSVTSIGNSAFYNCSGLTSITIGNSVMSIGDYAFRGCTGLTSITIPNSVTSIGESAFYNCSGLTSDTIPDGVTSIGGYAFSGCSGLTSVTIGNGVTSINYGTFSGCSSLASLTIGYSVTSIPYNAFADCKSLTSVVWNAKDYPDFTSNKTLFYYNDRSDNDFDLRPQITSFVFGDSVQHIPAYICTGMEKLTTITIPNSVTSIGYNEFAGCSNLETVTFGSGLQNIGDNAFKGCQNIYEMTVYATQVPNVVAEKEGSTNYGTFQGVSKLAELHVPAESVKKYKIHPVWGLFNVITAIPYTVTLLCDKAQGVVEGSGSYQPNEQVTITAKANAGYRFVQWSDGITTNPRTIVVASDTTLTAEFEEISASEYTVSVVVDPAQHGTVQMTLTAVPDEGYQFTRWSDGNTENPRTILVTENMTLSATFNLSTKVSNASAEENQDGTRKVFRNGQMYIIRGEKTYTATGSQL